MSRLSIRAFLAAAKRHLQKTLKEKSHATFVIGNESADLDSITSALVYGYIVSSKPEYRKPGRFVIPVTNIPASDLSLRPELTALLKHADIQPSELITLDDLGNEPLPADRTDWILVDHNSLQGKLGELYRSRVHGVIDHHDDEKVVPPDAEPRVVRTCGSCSSLVINHLRDTWQQISESASTVGAAHPQDNERLIDDFAYTSTWDAQAAKLALSAVLIDTVNLKASDKVREEDRQAVRYLEAKIHLSRKLGKDYDRNAFFATINDAKSHLDDLSLNDILRKDYKQWGESGLTLGISSCVKSCAYLQGKGEDFEAALKKFAQSKGLQLFAVMTAFNEDGQFRRQLLLLALSDSGKEAAERFVKNGRGELKLRDGGDSLVCDDAEVRFWQFWDQENLDASRKRVAPLMRDAISKL